MKLIILYFLLFIFSATTHAGGAFMSTAFFKMPAGGVLGIAQGTPDGQQDFACALLKSGAVKCWGGGYPGSLGNGANVKSTTPVLVSGLSSGVKAIAAGSGFACALLTLSGGVKCWGYNIRHQLGAGLWPSDSNVPVDVLGLTSGAAEISLRREHGCALLTSGGVRCWGDNWAGQLGSGSVTASDASVQPIGLASGVTAVKVFDYYSCAILSSGALKCWGNNTFGQLGIGSTTQATSPTDVVGLSTGVKSISMSAGHMCALMTGGNIKCWGSNFNGMCGNGLTASTQTSPVDVIGISTAVAIGVGESYTCALLADQSVKCWGLYGPGSIPVPMAGLGFGVVKSLAVGINHACAELNAGGIKCWGTNSSGELGAGFTSAATNVPLTTVGITASAGICIQTQDSTCAIVGKGVKCWGGNWYGQLGNGSLTNSTIPVKTLL